MAGCRYLKVSEVGFAIIKTKNYKIIDNCYKMGLGEIRTKINKVAKKKHRWFARRFYLIFEKEKPVKNNFEVLDIFRVGNDRGTQV